MAQGTEIKSEPDSGFTKEEIKDLVRLLKHPSISKMIDDVKKQEDKK